MRNARNSRQGESFPVQSCIHKIHTDEVCRQAVTWNTSCCPSLIVQINTNVSTPAIKREHVLGAAGAPGLPQAADHRPGTSHPLASSCLAVILALLLFRRAIIVAMFLQRIPISSVEVYLADKQWHTLERLASAPALTRGNVLPRRQRMLARPQQALVPGLEPVP